LGVGRPPRFHERSESSNSPDPGRTEMDIRVEPGGCHRGSIMASDGPLCTAALSTASSSSLDQSPTSVVPLDSFRLYFSILSHLIYKARTVRESFSYFQTPFRNAQVNRDSQVFGDLESRASAVAPTLFSLGGDPLPSQKFSRKYLTRHKKSGQLWRRAVRITPGGVESNVRYFKPHPFLADYGDGGYIYDVDGNKILDLMMGFGALL